MHHPRHQFRAHRVACVECGFPVHEDDPSQPRCECSEPIGAGLWLTIALAVAAAAAVWGAIMWAALS